MAQCPPETRATGHRSGASVRDGVLYCLDVHQGAALISLRADISRLLLGENLGREILSVVLGAVAEPERVRIVEPGAVVAGHPVDDLEPNFGMLSVDGPMGTAGGWQLAG